MSRYDLTTVGEACIRLSTRSGESLPWARTLDVDVAGAEGNVAGALAHLGWKTTWVSRLPEGPLAERVVQHYTRAGVDLSGLTRVQEGRVGTLFIERQPPPRATRVRFDRKDSAFTGLDHASVPWELLLDTRMLHLTGITSPLSPSVARAIQLITDRARADGIPFSYDVNYRHHLWSVEACASATRRLARDACTVFCNHRDAHLVLGAPRDIDQALDHVQNEMRARIVVMSKGDAGVFARIDGVTVHEAGVPTHIVDRAGAGDALAAGFLHGYLRGEPTRGLAYGQLMARLALTQETELVLTTHDELRSILSTDVNSQGGIER